MITHVVLMKFTDPGDSVAAKSRLEALPAEIAEIRGLTVGLDVGGTPSSYDLCLTTVHDDGESYRAYQGHPVHEAFSAWLRPRLADRAVVDYES